MRPERRLAALYLVTLAALGGVWVRAAWLMLVRHDAAAAEVAAARQQTGEVPAGRGRIVDANGVVLAEDVASVRLVFVPGEWASRVRYRCGACSAVVPRRDPAQWGRPNRPPTPPSRCACGARGSQFERMPADDLTPLEDAMGLPPGTLAGAAEDRLREVNTQIRLEVVAGVADREVGSLYGVLKARRAERGPAVTMDDVLDEFADVVARRSFYAEDLRTQRRADHYGRPTTFMSFRTPSGARLDVRTLPVAAERLIELDREHRYRGFRTQTFTQRRYPQRGLLAQCVGLVSPFKDGVERRAYLAAFGLTRGLPDVRVGRTGLEAAYESALRGTPGRARAVRDDEGTFSQREVVEAPRKGADVVLHLDAEGCRRAHATLAAAATPDGFAGHGSPSGGLVLLDAVTGHVLLWAETPVFDPNGPADEITKRIDDEEAEEAEWVSRRELGPDEDGPQPVRPALTLSRVARLGVDPGSAMKPVTALALMSLGRPLPAAYVCAGRAGSVEPRYPGCHPHPVCDCVGALAHSCNRYFADLASDRDLRAGAVLAMPDFARRLGIGTRTGVDVFGEGTGLYPRAIDVGRLRQLAIGQNLGATPLQMARICAAFAVGTHLPTPRVARSVGGDPLPDDRVPIAIDAAALAVVRDGMRGCVAYGTARGAFGRPALADVTVYGKSGTATVGAEEWMVGDEEWVDADRRRSKGPWHLWFVGFATKPGTRPVAFAVVLHSRRQGAGGTDAARVAADALEWWATR